MSVTPDQERRRDLVGTTYYASDYPGGMRAVRDKVVAVQSLSDEDLSLADRERMTARGEKTRLSVPLVYGDEVLGMMILVETERERTLHARRTAHGAGDRRTGGGGPAQRPSSPPRGGPAPLAGRSRRGDARDRLPAAPGRAAARTWRVSPPRRSSWTGRWCTNGMSAAAPSSCARPAPRRPRPRPAPRPPSTTR